MKTFLELRKSLAEDYTVYPRPKGISERGEQAFRAAFNKNAELVRRAGEVLLATMSHFKTQVATATRQGGEPGEDPEAHFYQHAYQHDQAGNIIGTNLIRDADQVRGIIRRFSVKI